MTTKHAQFSFADKSVVNEVPFRLMYSLFPQGHPGKIGPPGPRGAAGPDGHVGNTGKVGPIGKPVRRTE